jgi:predicted amidohydrolase
MHVACCQLDIAWEQKPMNYRRVEALLSAAGIPAGTLVLLPEMFATGFTMNAEAVAEPIDGPTPRFLAELARRHAAFVQAGVVIRPEAAARPRNEALLFRPDGRLLARYAKVHLFSFAGEQEHYAAGEEMVPLRLGQITVAPSICYDLRFPELFRAALDQGFEVLSVIACWPAAREEHWRALTIARAIENQCYVVAVNRCGSEPSGLAYSGGSRIVDPRGVVLTDAGRQEGVIQAALSLDLLRSYRREFPALRDRRL